MRWCHNTQTCVMWPCSHAWKPCSSGLYKHGFHLKKQAAVNFLKLCYFYLNARMKIVVLFFCRDIYLCCWVHVRNKCECSVCVRLYKLFWTVWDLCRFFPICKLPKHVNLLQGRVSHSKKLLWNSSENWSHNNLLIIFLTVVRPEMVLNIKSQFLLSLRRT